MSPCESRKDDFRKPYDARRNTDPHNRIKGIKKRIAAFVTAIQAVEKVGASSSNSLDYINSIATFSLA